MTMSRESLEDWGLLRTGNVSKERPYPLQSWLQDLPVSTRRKHSTSCKAFFSSLFHQVIYRGYKKEYAPFHPLRALMSIWSDFSQFFAQQAHVFNSSSSILWQGVGNLPEGRERVMYKYGGLHFVIASGALERCDALEVPSLWIVSTEGASWESSSTSTGLRLNRRSLSEGGEERGDSDKKDHVHLKSIVGGK